MALALWLIMALTDTGKAIRAVAKEKLGAELVGIDVAHIYAMTFGLGTACLAIAACLLMPTYYVNPRAGDAFVLIAFTIVVLGGMGSVPGALIGGLLIGVVESLGGFFFGESLGQIGDLSDLHRRPAVPSARPVRSQRVRAFLPIVVVVAALAAVPLIVHSNVVLNFLVVTLMIALAGQGWNILGGYGGQYSFGHAAFFGTGAYATAILQVRYGVNAWIGFAAGIAAGALVGAIIGALRVPRRAARLLFRAGDARLRRSAAHRRQRLDRSPAPASAFWSSSTARAVISVPEPGGLLSDHRWRCSRLRW